MMPKVPTCEEFQNKFRSGTIIIVSSPYCDVDRCELTVMILRLGTERLRHARHGTQVRFYQGISS
jgi:hypothetical protein